MDQEYTRTSVTVHRLVDLNWDMTYNLLTVRRFQMTHQEILNMIHYNITLLSTAMIGTAMLFNMAQEYTREYFNVQNPF